MTRLITLLLFVTCAYAQDPRGRILGRITDPSGAVVPDVPLTAMNFETGVVKTGQSNQQGNYLILRIPGATA